MSVDSLPYENDKEMFKHVVCVFVGKDRVYTERILKACGLRTLQGITNLIDMCLLTIEGKNQLQMHQLLQDKGRDVVRQESPDKPWKRSLLWCHEDSFNVLEQNKACKLMSVDSLPYENDKEMFKHVVCVFVGKDRVYTERILKACGLRTLQGITNLIDMCLLTIEGKNQLQMHQLLQDKGRDVVRQESPDKPWKRSLLWCHEDSFNVLEQNKVPILKERMEICELAQ
ncbi:hypothetical protein OSB04_013400 [Centaurea solstitialis]|uniref:Disease resistance protein Roq1-like winged-helix domain-containing protein n=1 Tax=Centaurea solstitialis TaxID=347529 RepID=A0AA38WR92_9ASTR|nr:hypothetical protein OSB04_013400 [Centaurea solstitialis]